MLDRGSYEDSTAWTPSWALSYGGLTSTVRDLGRWGRVFGKGLLVSPASHDEITRPGSASLQSNPPSLYFAHGFIYANGWYLQNPDFNGYGGAFAYNPVHDITLVVVAHHDAAPSGVIFGHEAETWMADHHPEVIERMTSNPPMWWLVIAGPALTALGSAFRSRRLLRLGAGLSLTSLLALVDIGQRRAVPGANDNLSGVAAMIEAADALNEDPPQNVRLMFVSMGAEEALQQGVRAYAEEHFPHLPRETTYFVVLDTVGFGRLVMLEAEGPVRLHDYDAKFKDLVAECAEDSKIGILRGLKSRNSTDGSVPQRHGYPTVSIVSVDERKLMPHYHLYSDTSENLDYTSVSQAAQLVVSIARRLGDLAKPAPR
jgi:hypothetical protein